VFAKELASTADEALARAASGGLRAIHLDSPLDVDRTLATDAMAAFRDRASALGVRLGVGIGSLNPFRPDRSPELFAAGGGNLVQGLIAMVGAAVALGCRTPMVVVGREEDRFASPIPWNDQLDAVAAALREVAPAVHDLGARVLVKTHEELTTPEALRIVDAVGADVVGVAFDPVNSIVRMEDPVSAAHRLAGVIGQVHVDDARIVPWGDQPDEPAAEKLARALVPVGDGQIDWAGVVAAVSASDPTARWWGEIHRAELTMPFRAQDWFARHPDARLDEVAAWLSLGSTASPAVESLVGDVPARIGAVIAAVG
jgi:sugar phosphate isomerase/epimerase